LRPARAGSLKFRQPGKNRSIELVTTFADQAVIAIENTRLFEAEQARTRELSKSLEHQTGRPPETRRPRDIIATARRIRLAPPCGSFTGNAVLE
jgi:GAF domain-containing protein